jgi:hypothetical protein
MVQVLRDRREQELPVELGAVTTAVPEVGRPEGARPGELTPERLSPR